MHNRHVPAFTFLLLMHGGAAVARLCVLCAMLAYPSVTLAQGTEPFRGPLLP